jgi:hypothetical protein
VGAVKASGGLLFNRFDSSFDSSRVAHILELHCTVTHSFSRYHSKPSACLFGFLSVQAPELAGRWHPTKNGE